MEAKARLLDTSRSLNGDLRITFAVQARAEDIDSLTGKYLRLTAVQWREKRSLNANSYFHKLCQEIANAVGSSLTEVKNRLIREYGQYFYDENGNIPTIMMKEDYYDMMLCSEEQHIKFVSRQDGMVKMALMRGSHTYDTKEMSRLIDGTVAEAKELGIETLTPDELERMKASWKAS